MQDSTQTPVGRSDPAVALQICRKCGGTVEAASWRPEPGQLRASARDGAALRLATQVPRWAVEYALQGFNRVTKYACGECGETAAVLAADE